MKCDHCHEKEANVKYTENVNGKKQELNLCYDCAKKIGVINLSEHFAPMFSTMFSAFPNLINEVKCEKCGYTLEDYKKTGLFGCEYCYETFEDNIDELLLKIQGKNRHIPKKLRNCAKSEDEKKLNKLRHQLEHMVKEEKYEEAAILRDEIRKLEGKEGC